MFPRPGNVLGYRGLLSLLGDTCPVGGVTRKHRHLCLDSDVVVVNGFGQPSTSPRQLIKKR